MALERHELLAQLRQAKIVRVHADYSGYGDEGHIDYAELYDSDGNIRYQGGDERFLARHEHEIVEALYEFLDEALQTNSPGWENNEGGAGSVEIDVAAGTIHFDHGYYAEPVLVADPFDV